MDRIRSLWKSRKAKGIVLGALGGFLWYAIVGCSTGGCPITSNPWISSTYGAILGFLWSFPGKEEEAQKSLVPAEIKVESK